MSASDTSSSLDSGLDAQHLRARRDVAELEGLDRRLRPAVLDVGGEDVGPRRRDLQLRHAQSTSTRALPEYNGAPGTSRSPSTRRSITSASADTSWRASKIAARGLCPWTSRR